VDIFSKIYWSLTTRLWNDKRSQYWQKKQTETEYKIRFWDIHKYYILMQWN